jgi:uncharacterized protein DUF6029
MKSILTFLFLTINTMIIAQNRSIFSAGLESIMQYYVDDDKLGDFNEENRFRSNNYLRLDYSFNGFQASIQFESYAPQALLNYSTSFDKELGVATYYAQYKNEKIDVLGGYFYEQFGSGLVYRSWEDRQLGLNNALRGGKVTYTPTENFAFTWIYGVQRNGFDVSNGQVFGFNTEIDFTPHYNTNNLFKMGFSYVGRKEDFEISDSEINEITHLFSGRIDFTNNNFYSKLEYIFKSKDALVEQGFVFPNKGFTGNAFLLNLGYSQNSLALDLTFRRLENMSFYSERSASGNLDNELIINYLPSLTKQQNYGLTNIYVYQAQPQLSFFPLQKAGEIGFQFDIYYNFQKDTFLGGKYGTKVALNFANWHGISADFDIVNRTYTSDFLKFGDKYYSDYNIEIRKKWSKKWFSIFSYYNIFYSKKYLEERVGNVNASIVVAESTYLFLQNKSVRLVFEHLTTKDDKKNWISGLAELNLSPIFSIFASDLYNYGNDQEIERIHYYNFGGSYSKNRTRLALSYGRQRGGLVCIGGICRFVEPSTGLTLNLTTSF